MKQFITIIIASCLLWIPVNSFAKVSTKISPELRYMNGNGKYHIDFDGGESELEFPVNNLMIGASLEVGSRYEKTGQNKGVFSMTLLAIPSGDAGTMKDSDWFEDDAVNGEPPHAGKDMYTESKVNLNGVMFDVNYAYHLRVNNNWTVGPMVGYRYQKLQYDVNGYRGIYYTTPVSGAGKSLEYENEFKMPYIGISSQLVFGKTKQFQCNFNVSYSDWASANDRDDHLLRSKLSRGDCDGHAYFLGLNAGWKFHPNWLLNLGTEYVNIDTNGTQHQSYYAGPLEGTTYDVNDEITFSSWSVMLSISYFAF